MRLCGKAETSLARTVSIHGGEASAPESFGTSRNQEGAQKCAARVGRY